MTVPRNAATTLSLKHSEEAKCYPLVRSILSKGKTSAKLQSTIF